MGTSKIYVDLWPHNKDDWPGKFDHIPFVFGKIISELSRVQLVNILVKDKTEKSKATFFLRILETKFTNINFIVCKTDRAWTRDFLPIFIKDNKGKKFLQTGNLMLGQNIRISKRIIKHILKSKNSLKHI